MSINACSSADMIVGAPAADYPAGNPGHVEPQIPATPIEEDGELPYIRATDIVWGINGHPLKQDTYRRLAGIEEQFDYIDSLRVTYYRVDVYVDTLRNDIASPEIPFSTLLDLAEKRGVHILPVITNVPKNMEGTSASSLHESERAGYRLGSVLATKYGTRVTHIEAGNELDLLSLREGRDGSSLAQYDSTTLAHTLAFLSGMTQAIRAGAPHVRIIINTAGWRHYAFFDALHRESVDYDVIGFHWYSEMGDLDAPTPTGQSVLEHLSAYNKDIWITELNRRNGSLQETSPRDQAFWIAKYVRDLYRYERIKGIFVYELYDELHLRHDTEAHYGLVACPANPLTCLGTKVPKPAFDAYRYAIEEQVHGYEDYAYWTYTRLMGRPPDAATLANWTSRLLAAGRQSPWGKSAFIASAMRAQDSAFVRALYRRVLLREPTDAEVVLWAEKIMKGTPRRDVVAHVCNSREFWELSGGTDAAFIERLNTLLLQGSAEPSWSLLPEDSSSRWPQKQVVTSILDSREYHALTVDEQYQALYGRLPDVNERGHAIERMQQHGLTQEGLIRELLHTREFWDSAIRAGYARRSTAREP